MNVDKLLLFWNVLHKDKKVISCNYKFKHADKVMFSKNHFVSSFDELLTFVSKYKTYDCYCTYNNLTKRTTRQFDNLDCLRIVGFDIEFEDKLTVETEQRMSLLRAIVKEYLIDELKLHNYLMTMSGNGIHLFASIGADIAINELTKASYRSMLKEIEERVNERLVAETKMKISMTDRVDINGILRIPYTVNTKCNRIVEIALADFSDKNNVLRKHFLRHRRINRKILSNNKLSRKHLMTDISLIPQTFEELESHPLVISIFDTDLPETAGWYSSVIFAIQALIKASGLPYNEDMRRLESEMNSMWNMTVSLSSCSSDDVLVPMWGAYNFYKLNEFTDYANALKDLLTK